MNVILLPISDFCLVYFRDIFQRKKHACQSMSEPPNFTATVFPLAATMPATVCFYHERILRCAFFFQLYLWCNLNSLRYN